MRPLSLMRVATSLFRTFSMAKLTFVVLLLCAAFFTFAGTAHAASVQQNRPIQPANTTGGGCTNSSYIKICISENSSRQIVPDMYVLASSVCGIEIDLLKNGSEVNYVSYSGCFAAGTHLDGKVVGASTGTWQTLVLLDDPNYGAAGPTLVVS